MTNQPDNDDILLPEEDNIGNYRNLIEILYHVIQERRQRGEIVDSQEVRFLEWLYHNQTNVNRGLTTEQLNQLPIHTQIESSEKGYCTICLSDFDLGNEIRTLPCVHQFHKDCIDLWLEKNKSCPNCNHIIGNEPNVYYTNNEQ